MAYVQALRRFVRFLVFVAHHPSDEMQRNVEGRRLGIAHYCTVVMLRALHMLVLPFKLSHAANAQTSRVDSVMVSNGLGQAVPFASLSIKGGSSRVADFNGVLLISREPGDSVNIIVRRMGYGAYQGNIGRRTEHGAFHVALVNSAQAVEKVAVTAFAGELPLLRNGFYDRMQDVRKGAPTGEFFTPEDLDARQPTKMSNFLYSSRYVKVLRGALTGRANCAMTLMVDGVVIHNMLGDLRDADNSPKKAFDDTRNTIDATVSAQSVMAVEVYPSVATAPMSIAGRVLGSTCGIIVVWTGARR